MPRTREQALANLAVHFRRLRDDPSYHEEFRRSLAAANGRPERRRQSSEKLREINARRYRCETCGMVTSVGALGKHQAVTNHRGRARVESIQERGRRGGLKSGAERARRCAEDPAYHDFISATVSASITDEQRSRSSEQMRAMQKVRWRCEECGMVSTPGGIGRHMKASGHRAKTRMS